LAFFPGFSLGIVTLKRDVLKNILFLKKMVVKNNEEN
jgi:hypothetical protein